MNERLQQVVCAGCFGVALFALPGALREVERGLEGPYGSSAVLHLGATGARTAHDARASGDSRELAREAVPDGLPGLDLQGSQDAQLAGLEPDTSYSSSTAIGFGADVDRPDLLRDSLVRPGI